jgi:pheromone shutdown-related protein TraB
VAVKIIGTSHIAPESLKKVEQAILKYEPEIVAVELDKKRLIALMQKGKTKPRLSDIRRVGFKGWLFSVVGAWVERKLGAKVGVSPGAEMIKAVAIAQEKGAKVALIDQDIEVTLRKFSKSLSWKEKWNFLVDIVKGLFGKGVKFDISKVPPKKLIKKLIADVKIRYPNIYRVLIKERNEYMAKRLAKIVDMHPEDTLIAVVGAGHEDEIAKLLKEYTRDLNTAKQILQKDAKLQKQT